VGPRRDLCRALDPVALRLGLAWLWLGFSGLVGVTIGLAELIAPGWVIQFRRSYLERASESQKRLGEAIDGFLGSPGPTAVRVIGCFVLAAGIAGLVAAGSTSLTRKADLSIGRPPPVIQATAARRGLNDDHRGNSVAVGAHADRRAVALEPSPRVPTDLP
jgi:hypothetical protein